MTQILFDKTFEAAGFISPDAGSDHVNTQYLKKKKSFNFPIFHLISSVLVLQLPHPPHLFCSCSLFLLKASFFRLGYLWRPL